MTKLYKIEGSEYPLPRDVATRLQKSQTAEHRIIIWKDKHGDSIWDATGDAIFDSALEILRIKVEAHYVPSVEDAEAQLEKYGSNNTEFTQEIVDQIPEGKIKDLAQKELDASNSPDLWYLEQVQYAKDAAEALEKEDKVLAFELIIERSTYEYEEIEIATPMRAKDMGWE